MARTNKKNKGGRKKVDPKDKVVLVGFYTKQRIVDIFGMSEARDLAKKYIESEASERSQIF